ncbi:hypothetical protein CSA56_17315 [candidate division KSB3 bacterium]|uniref:General secretion pathway GspH domain-containing protein n=1 Tax=candidate division KSB3 bacterium TaxID=2044937 RepID=A0A2G6K807_9BACT|nr:MAG: hypothetical protein CSA56_17315 [candidate division KSB3 bacterium]
MEKKSLNRRGVTLIEMLVVIGIIGVLAMIATPNFMSMIRRNRMRTVVTDLVNVLRTERSRALSLNRQVQLTLDTANKTYSVSRLAYTLYDPLSSDPLHPDILNYEDGETLMTDVSYDSRDWVESTTVSPDPFVVTFSPSGSIQMSGAATGSVKIAGYDMEFEIHLYKVGQVYVFRL